VEFESIHHQGGLHQKNPVLETGGSEESSWGTWSAQSDKAYQPHSGWESSWWWDPESVLGWGSFELHSSLGALRFWVLSLWHLESGAC
jgi:hypothetical protein